MMAVSLFSDKRFSLKMLQQQYDNDSDGDSVKRDLKLIWEVKTP